MKIDLRKLYSLASVNVDGTITFPEERLKSAGIIRLEDVSVHGKAIINYEFELPNIQLQRKIILFLRQLLQHQLQVQRLLNLL